MTTVDGLVEASDGLNRPCRDGMATVMVRTVESRDGSLWAHIEWAEWGGRPVSVGDGIWVWPNPPAKARNGSSEPTRVLEELLGDVVRVLVNA